MQFNVQFQSPVCLRCPSLDVLFLYDVITARRSGDSQRDIFSTRTFSGWKR